MSKSSGWANRSTGHCSIASATAAPELGARHVLVAGDDPDLARQAASLARFADMAAARGLTADLEFMPWTAARDLATAVHVMNMADRQNVGILIDALHSDRAGTSLVDVAALEPSRINYVQFCDGQVPFDPDPAELVRIARGERLFPGMGGIDLVGLARTIPADATISVEVPHQGWARRIDAQGRAAMAREATLAILRKAAEDQ
ncbi:sugar phosphate isomerase/epimerase family protein [Sinorhizobium psoraleae]|uniref:TIM barrel protein n=1 Tax=Sinorhizobium psoraleae TaxID=520838 RepID=A0ABT4KN67_9HYPH|nr:TIM barrel protein [Sinorhizobium psoraleae]MCZ4093294.1 TIM barrel protein [Sinorhizobium psoraleae]